MPCKVACPRIRIRNIFHCLMESNMALSLLLSVIRKLAVSFRISAAHNAQKRSHLIKRSNPAIYKFADTDVCHGTSRKTPPSAPPSACCGLPAHCQIEITSLHVRQEAGNLFHGA